MHVSRSKYIAAIRPVATLLAVSGALWIASGCSGSDDSQPPLVLTETNASAVTAVALISATQLTAGAQVPGIPTAVARRVATVQRTAAARMTSPRADGQPVAFDTQTEQCTISGSITETSSGTGAAGSSATITFNNCQEDANTKINGTLQLTIKSGSTGSSSFAFSITVNLTITAGPLTVTESGGYDFSLKSSSTSGSEVELSGSRLTVSISGAGAASDKLTLSNFDFDVMENLSSSPSQDTSTIDYDIDSTKLKGHISVMTKDPLKHLTARQFPNAGQVLITGANHGRIQITILGDETFTPPAGQGQVKIELDTGTGSFGAPIYASWATLQSQAGSAQ